MTKIIIDFGLPLLWVILWGMGGIWITQSVFALRRNELILVGVSIGLILQTSLLNLLRFWLPFQTCTFISPALVFLTGACLTIQQDWKKLFKLPLNPTNWIFLIGLTYIFSLIERGLVINQDTPSLAVTSLLAGGAFHTYFNLDTQLLAQRYPGFLMIVSAELQTLAFFPWNAWGLTRAFSIALGILLSGIWARRLTHSVIAGWIGSLFTTFGTGALWILLLFPGSTAPQWIAKLTGTTVLPYQTPLPWPFAFANTLFLPGALAHDADGLMGLVIILCLLITINRWRSPGWAALITILMLAGMALLVEPIFDLILLASAILTAAWVLSNKSIRLPRNLVLWWGILICSVLLILIQNRFKLSVLPFPDLAFQTGIYNGLSPFDYLLDAAPFILISPLLLFWGWKTFRLQRWLETSLILAILISFLGLYLKNTAIYMFVFAVPLAWLWSIHRSQKTRVYVTILGSITLLGGIILFSLELISATQPRFPPNLTSLDAQVYADYWNKLDDTALIFDSNQDRGEIIFGREIVSVNTLSRLSTPADLKTLGFNYVYLDETDWDQLGEEQQILFNDACIKTVAEYKAKHGDAFRRLLDIRACP